MNGSLTQLEQGTYRNSTVLWSLENHKGPNFYDPQKTEAYVKVSIHTKEREEWVAGTADKTTTN